MKILGKGRFFLPAQKFLTIYRTLRIVKRENIQNFCRRARHFFLLYLMIFIGLNVILHCIFRLFKVVLKFYYCIFIGLLNVTIYNLSGESRVMAAILQLKVTKRRLFEKVSLERCSYNCMVNGNIKSILAMS